MSWIERQIEDPNSPVQLSEMLNDIPLALARSLVLRSIDSFDTARRFFRPNLEETHDPFRLDGMMAGADRLARAVKDREHVMICGDFDADGVTSTALLVDFLTSQECTVSYNIPDRFLEGYGFHPSGVDEAVEKGASLIVVVDCGTASIATAKHAAERQIDLIICDHHENNGADPDCIAHINPKRPECTYPFREMAACGLAYKLVLATLDRLGQSPDVARPLLDLVAIGTVADLVPLCDENRVLVREGIHVLRNTQRPGLRALASNSRLTFEKLVAKDIGMRIAPLLNAAGRLEHAKHAVELLLASSSDAEQRAGKLHTLNESRRDQSQRVEKEARKMARKQMQGTYTRMIVLVDPMWHPGVLGPAASRLARSFNRPTLLLSAKPPEKVRNPKFLTGSARSIEGVNIYNAMASCQDLLVRFGGHPQAAGVTLRTVDYQELRSRLNAYVESHCDPDSLVPKIHYDAELNLEDISKRFMSLLRQFQPLGKCNESPIFRVRNAFVSSVRTTTGNHLQLQVRSSPGSGQGSANDNVPQFRCIGFGQGKQFKKLEEARQQQAPIEMLCAVEDNTFRGVTTTQLRIEHVRVQASDP